MNLPNKYDRINIRQRTWKACYDAVENNLPDIKWAKMDQVVHICNMLQIDSKKLRSLIAADINVIKHMNNNHVHTAFQTILNNFAK